ncbi:unnamed protein product, partial [Prorocentrum cordatum]
VVCDQPGLRLGCLELFVRLRAAAPGDGRAQAEQHAEQAAHSTGHFAVSEDHRQRRLVRWRAAPTPRLWEERAAAIAAGRRPTARLREDQTWRASCALTSGEPEAAGDRTLGLEAVDWLWEGLNALVLAVSPGTEAVTPHSAGLFGPGVYVGGSAAAEAKGEGRPCGGWRGVVGFCFEELCRRAEADPDPARYCLGLSLWELLGDGARDLLAEAGEDTSHELRFETAQFKRAEDAMSLLEAAGFFGGVHSSQGPRHLFARAVLFDAQWESLAALHFAEALAATPRHPCHRRSPRPPTALWPCAPGCCCP